MLDGLEYCSIAASDAHCSHIDRKEKSVSKRKIRNKKGWNTKFINSEQAWAPLLEDTEGDDFNYGDVRVGHIDTGYIEHSVFGSWSDDGSSEHILVDRGRNLIDPERDSRPTDPVDGGLNPGHGARIGSVMYGFAPGSMVGVAPRVPVVPYRAVTSVALLSGDEVRCAADAIDLAVDEGLCSVINISMGARPVFLPFSPFRRAIEKLGEACDRAYEKGVIIVAALGNNIHDRATYPAKFPRTIAAGGIEPIFRNGELKTVEMWKPQPNFLNEHDYQYIDVWAPAEAIYRVRALRRTGDVQNEYAPESDGDGTSYAAAAASGAAAIWLARRAAELQNSYPANQPWMVVEAFRKLLREHRKKRPDDAPSHCEAPLLDVKKLVEADLPAPSQLRREEQLSADMWG